MKSSKLFVKYGNMFLINDIRDGSQLFFCFKVFNDSCNETHTLRLFFTLSKDSLHVGPDSWPADVVPRGRTPVFSLFFPSSSIFSRPYREAGRFSLQINHVPISDKTMCVANSCEISYHRDAKWVFSFEGLRCTRLIYILRYCPKFGPAPLPLCDTIGWEKSQLYSWEMFRNVRNDDPRSTTDV